MDKILIALAESIFRGTCTKYGYDLSKEDEFGILDETFFCFLVDASRIIAQKQNIEPADALETYAVGFAMSEEVRANLIECYTQWVKERISNLAESSKE